MKNIYIELNFSGKHSRLARNNFLLELYTYALKSKGSKHVELNFSKDIFENIDKCIFNKIFISYTFENANRIDTLLNLAPKDWEVLDTSEVTLKTILNSPSYETMKIIQKLGWDKMMMFKEIQLEDSIVIGSYDYQNYVIISNIDDFDVIQIKELLNSHFSADIIRTITHSNEII